MAQLVKYADGETHKSVLESEGLKFLLSGEGTVPLINQVEVEVEREGKMRCLFFSAKWCHPCRTFTPKLLRLYNSVERGKLDIIFVSLDRDEATFCEHTKLYTPLAAPSSWLVVPFHDEATRRRLCRRYRVRHIPSLVPLGSDGRTVMEDAVRLVEEYGSDAIPFGANRRRELEAIDAANRDGGNLQQLLGSTGSGGKFNNYVISRDGRQINVAELVGKTVGLYFGARWCPPCRNFTTMLVESYNELKSSHSSCGFEIVFISTDRDEEEFASSLAEMPWLAVPYCEEDLTRRQLSRIYDVKSIPALILLGPDGKILCRDGRAMISSSSSSCGGAKLAFPFTESRAAEVEMELMKQGQGLPCQVRNSRHEHLLKLDTAKAYVCDACGQQGRYWVFSCQRCNFDLHPCCVDKHT